MEIDGVMEELIQTALEEKYIYPKYLDIILYHTDTQTDLLLHVSSLQSIAFRVPEIRKEN
jgi:hypothetical protein